MKYELIIFDADETLFDFKKSEKAALENTMRDFQFEYKEETHLESYMAINSKVWKELEQGLITQSELNLLRFQRFLNHFELEQDVHKFANTYIRHLSQASFLYEESPRLIRELNKNHRLVILSNGLKAVQENRLKKSSIAEYFEDIIISEDVGLAKPDPKIFALVFSRLKHNNKKTSLIVGDSLTSDIRGGISFGIDTCWLNAAAAENQSEIKPTFEINHLNELKSLPGIQL